MTTLPTPCLPSLSGVCVCMLWVGVQRLSKVVAEAAVEVASQRRRAEACEAALSDAREANRSQMER